MSTATNDLGTNSDSHLSMHSQDLTLIVAATNRMGIGRAGILPWTGLKKEMAYFTRVTKRSDPGVSNGLCNPNVKQLTCMQRPNAVLMGRKTWESIPPRFRPLKDRQNVVITRQDPDVVAKGDQVVAGSLDQAIASLRAQPEVHSRLFVIGGAQIYKASIEAKKARRILLTRILDDFECDTFFPITLGEDGTADGWKRKSKEDLDQWAGEKLPEGVQEENSTRYVFEMWERI
ncbi:dihydrofolate reductase [Diplocarpon rosae]|nr:dihydrofolate reductase [Diplocarpon rosae]